MGSSDEQSFCKLSILRASTMTLARAGTRGRLGAWSSSSPPPAGSSPRFERDRCRPRPGRCITLEP
uniref:Uncharacterized protein n=1 Tax=Arundo donax TaxID=35708 RepID=A0A0A9GFL6_ARUDO